MISKAFATQLETFVSAHLPTRVLVGGLPPFVIEQIARSWTLPTQLFLVCGPDNQPTGLPATVCCCRADDLTAERSESWVALVDRSQSRAIQESVRSSGAGTVREVWQAGFPWHACNLPGVRWPDVLKTWISLLGLDPQTSHVIDLATQFRNELRSEVDDSERLFEALDGIAAMGASYDNISFAVGFPQHAPGATLRRRGEKGTVLACLDELFDRLQNNGPETFAELKEAAESLDPVQKAATIAAIDIFISRYRSIDPIDSENPVRAWRKCFANNQAAWRALSYDILMTLLGVKHQPLRIERCELASGPGAELIEIGESLVVVRNHVSASLTATFTLNQPLADKVTAQVHKLYARATGTPPMIAGDVPAGAGPHPFKIRLRDKPRHVFTFWLGVNSSEELGKMKSPVIWECSPDYPLILASARSKKLTPGRRRRARGEENRTDFCVEQGITLPFQGRAVLQGFIHEPNGDLKWYTQAGESNLIQGLEDIGTSGVKRFTLVVDVADGSAITLEWVGNADLKKYQATISFSVKGEAGPRSDSLTAALVDAHRRGNAAQLRAAIANIKKPARIRADDLPIKTSTKAIAPWESLQQSTVHGWWPILVDDRALLRSQPLARVNGIHRSEQLRLNDQANAWKHAMGAATNPPPAEVQAYIDARAAVIAALAAQFEGITEEVPLGRAGFIGFIAEPLLEAHVRAFTAMITAATSTDWPAEWRWKARSLDTVLAFPAGGNAPSAALFGPFHPLNLARNHGVQRCLGERLASSKSTSSCSFALLLGQAQSLYTGQILGSQLEPVNAVCFPSGDPCWTFLHRQQGDSFLPHHDLVNWLKMAGLDPVVGPLGIDPEVLPDTMRQYSLAYPTRRTLDLLLEDCSQATFSVIRDDLSAGTEEKKSIRDVVPGTLRVYAPKAEITHFESETIAFDPDLPLLWHDIAQAGRDADIATLARSNQVHLTSGTHHGAHSSAVPTIRRPLVNHSASGLLVTAALVPAAVAPGLANAVHSMIASIEARDHALAWGSSLHLDEALKARWTLCSAGQVDPRLFVDYVERHPNTALWTYKLFNVDSEGHAEFGRGHFLLARVGSALQSSLQALLSAAKLPVKLPDLLLTLARAGLTLGDEFLKTGRAAEGALGQFLIERLAWNAVSGEAPLPHSTCAGDGRVTSAGFILQVDPISSILKSLSLAHAPAPEDSTDQRSDLIAFNVKFCGDQLWIKPTVIESKYRPAGIVDPVGAVAQAEATATKLSNILEACIVHPSKPEPAWWAQPERLLVADIIYLGLRLASGTFKGKASDWAAFETRVLSAVLSGEFNRTDTGSIALIHYAGPTNNKLATKMPHALVSLDDARTTLAGTAVEAYEEVRSSLTRILRHDCSELAQEKPDAMPAPPATEPAIPSLSVATVKPGAAPNTPNPVATSEIGKADEKFRVAFEDFIGNRNAIDKLRDDIVDALIKSPPHLPNAYLLTGNPSTGKTTLANKVAKLLGVTFVKLVGTNIKNERDLIEQVDHAFKHSQQHVEIIKDGSQGIPEYVYPECLIFIDEIHLVKTSAQEGLLTLTEPKDRYVRLKDRICRFPKATYMAATTRDSEIDKALRTRFGNPIHLNDYKPTEVAKMLAVKQAVWAAWSEEVRLNLALLARCVPREAERLAGKLERKMNVSLEKLSVAEAQEKLRLEEGLDRNGLDRVYWKALRALAMQDRPVGRDQLAQRLGLTDEDKLVNEIIPTLQARGLVTQVSGGQQITDKGRLYLRNEPAPSED